MLKKIAITGPESTGKSWLAEQLAKEFNTVWVPEFAREYLSDLHRNYTIDDVVEIAKGQQQNEKLMEIQASEFLFSDTEMFVCSIWTEFVFGKVPEFIRQAVESQQYDLYLLCNIDLPWEPDPLREHPDNREDIFEKYRLALSDANLPYVIINGLGKNRLAEAINAVKKQFLL